MNHVNYYIWNPEPTLEVVKRIKKIQPDVVNFFCQEEYEKSWNWHTEKGFGYINRYSKTKEVNLIFGSDYCDFYKNRPNVPKNANLYFWPTFWCTRAYSEMINNEVFDLTVSAKPSKLFMSLNNQPHRHRCEMLDYLAKHNLIDNNDITWHYPDVDFSWTWWKPKKMLLDEGYAVFKDSYKTVPVNSIQKTLFSLVAESTTQVPFITEKTWMNILWGRPFLIYGHKDIYKTLRRLGFEDYDELFDYGFEKVENDTKRLQLIINNVINLQGKNLFKLHKKIKPKLERNRKLALEYATNYDVVPEPWKKHLDEIRAGNRKAEGPDLFLLETYFPEEYQ